VRSGPAVRGVEDQVIRPALPRFFLERAHQQLSDPLTAEALADNEAGALAAWIVALDEDLLVEDYEARDLAGDLGDEDDCRRIVRDPFQPFRRLFCRRRIPELVEEAGDRRRILASCFAKAYGGGGGGPPGGGASSSTYVLLRPHPPP
jgi:hypothetical protein